MEQPVTGYYGNPQAYAQAMGMPQPAQQVFQHPGPQQPQPASTMQAMNQQAQQQWQQIPVQPNQRPAAQVVYQAEAQQPRIVSADEFNRQVEELAENKFRVRQQEVINNAMAAMKGVQNMFGMNNNNQQQQQNNQPSFWDTTTGKITIGGMGGALGIGGYKLISKFFGGNSGGYSPSPQEINTAAEALKTLFK